MKNNKRLRGVFAALICFAVMGLTSCVAILDDFDSPSIKSAYLPSCHDDEIMLTYTGSLEDYRFYVEVLDSYGRKLGNYYIEKEKELDSYGYEKKYLIQMNRSLQNSNIDTIMVRCSNKRRTIIKHIYMDEGCYSSCK